MKINFCLRLIFKDIFDNYLINNLKQMLSSKEINKLIKPINQNSQQPNESTKYTLDLSRQELRKVPQLPGESEYMSYNFFKKEKQLEKMGQKNVHHLNLSFNFFENINGKIFASFTHLKILNLSANKIQSVNIDDDNFPVLECLYLKNNKIKYFVHCPSNVQVLSLDHNKLDRLAFSGGQNAQIISASVNSIQQIEFEHCQKILYLDLEDNKLQDLQSISKLISKIPKLLAINLHENYVSKINHKKYLMEVLSVCDQIVKIDQMIVNPHVREAFKLMRQEEQLEGVIDKAQQNFQQRMEEQLRIKEEMMEKLKEEQKELQSNFINYIQKEKEQLDALEEFSKNKKSINKQVTNSDYGSHMKHVTQVLQPRQKQMEKFNNINIDDIVKQMIIMKHKNEYQNYKQQKVDQQTKNREKTNIEKYLLRSGLGSPLQKEKQENDQVEDLNANQIERRKNNMKNPNLIYRNSKDLIQHSEQNIKQDKSESKEENIPDLGQSQEQQIVNIKSFAFLIKNYGFHTIP